MNDKRELSKIGSVDLRMEETGKLGRDRRGKLFSISPGIHVVEDGEVFLKPFDTGNLGRLIDAVLSHGLREERLGKKKKERTNFWASEVGKCKRQVWFKFNPEFEPAELKDRALEVFHLGDLLHEDHTKRLNLGPELGYPVRVIHEETYVPRLQAGSRFISGRYDLLLEVWGIPVLVDFKTIEQFAFGRLVASGEPRRDNVLQLQIYLHALQKVIPNLKWGLLLYYNKGASQRFPVPVPYDSEIARGCLEYFEEVDRHILSGEPPVRDYVIGVDWQCSYCQFQEDCLTIPSPEVEVSVPEGSRSYTQGEVDSMLEVLDKVLFARGQAKLYKEEEDQGKAILKKFCLETGVDSLDTKKGKAKLSRSDSVSYDMEKVSQVLSGIGKLEEVLAVDGKRLKGLLKKEEAIVAMLEVAKEIKPRATLTVRTKKGAEKNGTESGQD